MNIQLIYDYINGNDIEYDIEELENNTQFMMNVLKISKDKNMYELCSNKVKEDYEFIVYLVNLFKNDKDFIMKISRQYILNENNDEINRMELMTILNELITNNNSVLDDIKIRLWANYETDKFMISIIKENNKNDKNIINDLGKGFFIIKEKYNDNESILKYYAKKMIDDILEEEKINLENSIHSKFNNYEELEKIGINNFIITLLREYDNYLADFIIKHTELLNDLKKEIYHIKKRWNYFIENNNRNKWELLLERLKVFLSINKDNIICELFYCYCIENSNFNYEYISSIDFYNKFVAKNFNYNNLTLKNRMDLKIIKEIFINTFNIKIVEKDFYDIEFYNDIKNQNDYKILNFNNKKNIN